jgi:hypothetical protein
MIDLYFWPTGNGKKRLFNLRDEDFKKASP